MEDKAKFVFEKINDKEAENKGKIVAIEVESGDYFIGDSELDAYQKAIEKYPDKKFVFKRIGFASTHFVGLIW